MLRHWPIRTKLQVGLGLLLAAVLALFGSALYGLSAYRGLLRAVVARSAELPLATDIRQHVSDLQFTVGRMWGRHDLSDMLARAAVAADSEGVLDVDDYTSLQSRDPLALRKRYVDTLYELGDAVAAYRQQWESNGRDIKGALGDNHDEETTLAALEALVATLRADALSDQQGRAWILDNHAQLDRLYEQVGRVAKLADKLPEHLRNRSIQLASEVRASYSTAIIISWSTAIIALVTLVAAGRVFYKWFASPLETLVAGSRRVAEGDFDHRIRLPMRDELGELADAMNAMTARFQEIHSTLNEQVREQANQMVRSAQLASVGFLAAGVSHEINNPLASIALCGESLESRLHDLLAAAASEHAADVEVIRNYLQMIQREAFRCKQITEKLLDFARRGDSQRASAELRELTSGVIEMVDHLGRYRDRHVELVDGPPVIANVNAQEIKQVILNLITNALESMDPGGRARITIGRTSQQATIAVEDAGCGFTDEVRKHLFEPFFTRRKNGQGTGLGLSITHRIVEDHGGQISAESEGPGRGSRFTVTLPLAAAYKESHHRRQAA